MSTQLNTTITEPAMAADEVEMNLFALERSRATFAWKVGGLDAAALNRAFPPSTMTLGGLVKHLALCEAYHVSEFVVGGPLGEPWSSVQGTSPWEWGWATAPHDTPDELYALWAAEVDRSRAAWGAALAKGGLEQPTAWKSDSGESLNLRRSLVDLNAEYARHIGHADLMREAIDGLVGEDPPQD